MATNDEKLVYTVEEAGALLGLGRSGAYDAVRRGDLPTIRIGRRILVPKEALERMLSGVSPANNDLAGHG